MVADPEWLGYRQHANNAVGARGRSPLDRTRSAATLHGEPARRAEQWASLLDRVPVGTQESVRALLSDKVDFERARASLPRGRVRRFGAVTRLTPRYPRLASAGLLTAAQDLLLTPRPGDGVP